MKFFFSLLAFFSVFTSLLYSAFEYKNFSANSSALANIKTVIDDESIAVLYNPASISNNQREIDFFYTRFYDIDELPINALAVAVPFLKGSLGFGYSSFGKSNFYQEETIALCYKFHFSNCVNLGLNYKNLNLDLGEMGYKKNFYAMDFAGKIDCSNRTKFGFLLSNVNRPKIGKYYKEEIYRDFNVGYSYLVRDNIKFLLEYVKQVGYESDYRYALEMNFFRKFFVRIGSQNNINLWTAGFGLKNSFYEIDYAYNYHFDLGVEHFFTIKFYL